jgi:hypothetical protein
MIRQFLVKCMAHKLANGDIDVRFPHQLAIVDDASQQARKHQPDRNLRIDTRPTIVATVAVSDLTAQPRQVESAIDAHQHMVVKNKLP